MTISFKADASGNSGAIQVAGVDRLTLNLDGSLLAGANPATGNRSMALATMQKFADEFGASLVANGYQKLPSGLIIQWGIGAAVANNVSQNIVFPISFPNTCFGVYAQSYRPTSTTDDVFSSVSAITPSQFTVTMSLTAGTFAPMWFAMGY